MISRNELKYIQSLYHKKARDKENAFIVEGPKMVEELLHSDFKMMKVFATPGPWLEKHAALLSEKTIQEVTIAELQKASHLETPNQVMAIAGKSLADSVPASQSNPSISLPPVTLVLDGIQDPGNFGTLIRIADWFGVEQIVTSPDSVDVYNPKVVQSTMGSIFRVPVMYTDLPAFLEKQSLRIYGALLDGQDLGALSLQNQGGILVIGNESKGIRPEIMPYISEAVTIPAYGKAESLNAAVAGGIILSHLRSKTGQHT